MSVSNKESTKNKVGLINLSKVTKATEKKEDETTANSTKL